MQPDVVMILFPFLFLFVAPCCLCQLKQCYYSSGVISPDFPCDPSANVSACCGGGYTCATNFYCPVLDTTPIGSCTDKTWQNPACPLPLSLQILMILVLSASQTLTVVQILGTTTSTTKVIQQLAPMGLSVPIPTTSHAVLTIKGTDS